METNNLQNLDYEELCSLVQQGEMTWSEWIDAQPELYEGYDEWLQNQGLERNDNNAMRFISMVEEEDMQEQVEPAVTEISETAAKARRVIQ